MDKYKGIYLILIGLLFCTIGTMFGCSYDMKRLRCTEGIQATLIGYEEHYIKEYSIQKERSYSHPVFEYEYGEVPYKETSTSGTNNAVGTVGKSYTIYIDPDDPSDFYFEGLARHLRKFIAGIIFGGFLLVVGLTDTIVKLFGLKGFIS